MNTKIKVALVKDSVRTWLGAQYASTINGWGFFYPDRGFSNLTEVFRSFCSVVRQIPGYKSQRRGTARTPPITG
jgi:hypothetical protein